jgi:hypothetical protein
MALSASAVRDDFKRYGSSLKAFADVQMKEVMEAADRLAWAARREEVEAVAHEFDAQVLTLCNLQSEAEACISAINKVYSLCRAEAARIMRMKVRCGPKKRNTPVLWDAQRCCFMGIFSLSDVPFVLVQPL